MNTLIDVIIPAYKAHKTIVKTLCSICMQTVSDIVQVIIVNDCCPEGSYENVVKMFSPLVKVKELKMPENGGPGLARQLGIDEGKSPYFTCIDADDVFADELSLNNMLLNIDSNPKVVCACGVFIELHPDKAIPHHNDMVWMFGKIYRRSFIKKYDIRFNSTRANEDTGFNTKIKLLCSDSDDESIKWFSEPVYFWNDKPDSITRVNDCQYSYDQSFCGWTDNMIEAVNFAKQIKPFNGFITRSAMEFMLHLYTYYIQTLHRAPIFAKQNFEYCKKYYNLIYKGIEPQITPKIFAEAYSVHMQHECASGSMIGFIPELTIQDFMQKLKEEPYNPDDLYDILAEIPEELRENNVKCGVCAKDYDKRVDKG